MYKNILKGAPLGNCNAIGGGTGCGSGGKGTVSGGGKHPLYHGSHSEAMSSARDYVEAKGFTISDDDWFTNVSGTRKPGEGKTVSFNIPLQRGGEYSGKYAHVQVYNRGNDIPKNYELNVYVDGGRSKPVKKNSVTKSDLEQVLGV